MSNVIEFPNSPPAPVPGETYTTPFAKLYTRNGVQVLVSVNTDNVDGTVIPTAVINFRSRTGCIVALSIAWLPDEGKDGEEDVMERFEARDEWFEKVDEDTVFAYREASPFLEM